MVSAEDVREGSIITDPNLDAYIESVDAGYDHAYFHRVDPDQKGFFGFAEEELLPALR
jgi:hypothetical protein